MQRIKNWDVALSRAMTAALARAHEWGGHDCVLCAADCVVAMTGEDPAADVRGKYDSALTAARVIKDAGFECLGDMVAARFPEIQTNAVRRGDLILADGEHGEFIAVVVGATAAGPAGRGLVHVPLEQAKRAFKVGA